MNKTPAGRPSPKSAAAPTGRGSRGQAAGRPVRGGAGRSLLRDAASKLVVSSLSAATLIRSVQAGLPVRELEVLQTSLGLPLDNLAARLGISRATLHRRKAGGRLAPAESDRVVRFARLLGKASEVLESEEHARQWLTSPQVGLGGAVPLDYAGTEVGAREVEDLLGRIEYGVYS
jgi:putative toxin-antitoxin system antitoxin component (TIGR02293 family)